MGAGAADGFHHPGYASGRVGITEFYKWPFLHPFCFDLIEEATEIFRLMGGVFSFEVRRLVEINRDKTKHLACRTVDETARRVEVSQEGDQHAFSELEAIAQAVADINLWSVVGACRKVIAEIVMQTFPFIKTRVCSNGV